MSPTSPLPGDSCTSWPSWIGQLENYCHCGCKTHLTASFSIEALNEAIRNLSIPEIFNSDQGSQFTSEDFISMLKGQEIKISMDGKGRCNDNVFIKRLWRTLKYDPKTFFQALYKIQNSHTQTISSKNKNILPEKP